MNKYRNIIIGIIIIVLIFGIIYITKNKENKELDIKPVVKTGLIPIKYKEGSIVIANEEDWYNYDNQEWANAVTVKNEYVKYRNSKPGTIIPNEAINSMWVWIPRFSYCIDYITETDKTKLPIISVEEKDINLQLKIVTKDVKENGNGMNGNYKTHEAFTFGSQELNGIWIGKFEASTNNKEYLSLPSYETAQNVDPVILPEQTSLRFQDISTQLETSQKISNSSNYGIKDVYDSHMMKNSDWEAMVLFTKSKYGITGNQKLEGNNKISYNASKDYITGRSMLNNEEYTYDGRLCVEGTPQLDYGKSKENGYRASTTGNITGIYDTVGGAYEYVSIKYKNFSGVSEECNSGYEGFISEGKTDIKGKSWQDERYYDVLNTSYNQFMVDWNEGYKLPNNPKLPFILRSSTNKDEKRGFGISSYFCACGDYDESVSFRIVLTEK